MKKELRKTGFWQRYDPADPDSEFIFMQNEYDLRKENEKVYKDAVRKTAKAMMGESVLDEAGREQIDSLTMEYARQVVKNYTPYDFLHGDCNIFAQYLHETYGYAIEAVMKREEDRCALIHMYCIDESSGAKEYIDVRGRCTDFDLLMEDFCDFYDKDDEDIYVQRFEAMPKKYAVKEEDSWRTAVAKCLDIKFDGYYTHTAT